MTTVRNAASTTSVAIIGAGVSGIVTARMLADVGCRVTIFEQAADVGGVWSESRRYPTISTQDDRRSYSFSDAPMPEEFGEHPRGADVRAHLAQYVAAHGLAPHLHLATEVVTVGPVDDRTWEVETSGPRGRTTARFDWVVAANGLFSIPHVPDWPGRDAFEAAGGRVLTPGSLGDGSVLHGRTVVVVGWGKTACDVATVASGIAETTTLVARRLTWKYPKRIGSSSLNFRHLVLTRAGERFIGAGYRTAKGRILLSRLPERLPRKLFGRWLANRIASADRLDQLGLRPTLEVGASTSLVTDGFYDAVGAGRITVAREASVVAVGADDAGPWCEITGGKRIAADTVIAATGYEQSADFLADSVLREVDDNDAAIQLYRRVLAVDFPHLAFMGSAHSYRSPLISEVTAAWLAGVVSGLVTLPSIGEQRRLATPHRLTAGKVKGVRTGHLPGVASAELDGLLRDLGVPLSARTRLKQWSVPFDPADYARSLSTFRSRAAARRA